MSSPEVEEIKQRLDIIDVVSEYVQLKPGGINWKGLCPFHNEKSPSFMVNRERKFWHCFGCNEGGDVFAFFQKIEQVDFVEALKLLAARAGVELKSFNPQAESLRSKLIAVHELACAFFQKQLYSPTGSEALNYLRDRRKLSDETIKTWRLGYALDDWRGLLKWLTAKGYREQDIVTSGLALTSNGRTYDRFRNRIMFPISSVHGQVVGFSARTMRFDSNEPKYINSPQTAIYDKGNIVYGLFQARQSIRKEGHVILVEGNMDVIASSQAGVINVAAASGTGLTTGHLQALSRFTKELHFCFDADAAGLKAAERGIALALTQQFFVKVIAIPKELGKDPGDLVERDPDLWRNVAGKAVPIMDYLLRRVESEHNLTDVSVKKQVFPWLIGWLEKITEPVEREHYLKRVAEILSLDESVVRGEVSRRILHRSGQIVVSGGRNASIQQEGLGSSDSAHELPLKRHFETVFSLSVQSDDLFGHVIQGLEFEFVPDEYAELYKLLVHHYTIHNRTLLEDQLLSFLRNESPETELTYLSVYELGKEELSQFPQQNFAFQELRTRLERYRRRLLTEKRNQLAKRIAEAERTGNAAGADTMLQEFQAISRQLTSE